MAEQWETIDSWECGFYAPGDIIVKHTTSWQYSKDRRSKRLMVGKICVATGTMEEADMALWKRAMAFNKANLALFK